MVLVEIPKYSTSPVGMAMRHQLLPLRWAPSLGLLAHLGERLPCTQEAVGSSPTESTKLLRSSSGLGRRPLTAKIRGSNPLRSAKALLVSTKTSYLEGSSPTPTPRVYVSRLRSHCVGVRFEIKSCWYPAGLAHTLFKACKSTWLRRSPVTRETTGSIPVQVAINV